MKRMVVTALLLFFCSALNTQGQQSGGVSQALTNDSIVKLANAGLGEETLVSLVNVQKGRYSLGAEDILLLKKAGVSEKVIAAMLNKSTFSAGPASALAASPEVMDVGVYFKKAETWAQLMPEVVNWQTGGVIKSHVTAGIVKGDINGRLDGMTSRNPVTTPVDFLFRLPEGVEITEYQLVHLHEHGHSREFRTVTGGVFHQSGGAKRDTLAFEYKKVGPRTFAVSLSQLDPGEYGFLSPGAAFSSHASAQLGKMYTFHFLE